MNVQELKVGETYEGMVIRAKCGNKAILQDAEREGKLFTILYPTGDVFGTFESVEDAKTEAERTGKTPLSIKLGQVDRFLPGNTPGTVICDPSPYLSREVYVSAVLTTLLSEVKRLKRKSGELERSSITGAHLESYMRNQ